MKRILALFLLLVLALPAPAPAQAAGAAEGEAFRAVITSQIEAFRKGDGSTAYSFASPKIRQIFPSVDQFMGMVERGYPQIWRPESFTFGDVTNELGGPTQRVLIRDGKGKLWSVLYLMEQQPDGSWKINGVKIEKAPAGEA